MDENKYKESIDEYIGDEKLFNQQLKGRILNEIRRNKQRKGMPSLFRKITPVVIGLLLLIGSGTFFYLSNLNDKQKVSSPSEDPAALAEQEDDEENYTMSQLFDDSNFNDTTVLNVNVLDDKGLIKQNLMIENEIHKKEILNEFLKLKVRKLKNAYILPNADYQVIITTEKEISMFVMKEEKRVFFLLPQQGKESYFEMLNGDKFFAELDNVIQSVSTLPNKGEVPSDIMFNKGDGEIFYVPISSIPDFEKYLAEASDINIELERIQVEYLDWNFKINQYYMLKYGCGNKICQLVLVQISELDEVKTLHLGEGIFTGFEGIENTVMLRIGINEGNELIRHQIVILDLNTMQIQHPNNKKDDELYFNVPIYPITQFKWMTRDTIELVVADVPDTTYESIEKWYKSNNPPVKSIKITIE